MSQIQTLREVRNQYYTAPNPPASTLVEVSKLARDEYLLEIEAIAILPE
jgi:enamine deaminase RidA (YjgF/YER057c/UK114 family)